MINSMAKNIISPDLNQIKRLKRRYGRNDQAKGLISSLEYYMDNRSKLTNIKTDMAVSFYGTSASGEQVQMRSPMRQKGFDLLRREMIEMTEVEITRTLKELSEIPEAKVIPISFARVLA